MGCEKRDVLVIVAVLLIAAVGVVMTDSDLATCQADLMDLYEMKYINATVSALMIDASGNSINEVGKFEQCIYQWNEVYADLCVLTYNALFENQTVPFETGFCIPKSCNGTTFAELAQQGIFKVGKVLRNPGLMNGTTLAVTGAYCTKTQNPPLTGGAIGVITFMSLLGFFCLVGTIVDELIKYRLQKKVAFSIQEDGTKGGYQVETETRQPLVHSSQHEKPQPFWVKFVRAFSVTHNWSRLAVPVPGNLNALNGLRVMSMFWIILGHTGVFMNNIGVDNLAYLAKYVSGRVLFQFLPAGEFAVDSFFYLSAFLTTYFTLQSLLDKGRVSWAMYYFHRVWRLTPVYAFVLFFWWQLAPYFVTGPLWFQLTPRIEATCGPYWWTNLLYINNFWPTMEINMCLGWSWYLAVDMQFYIMSPILIFVFYKSARVGWIFSSLLLLLSFGANIGISEGYNLNYNLLLPSRETYYNHIYTKPYARAPPYIMGIMAAVYYLTLERRGSSFTRLSKPVLAAGYIISAVCMLFVTYCTKTLYTLGVGWSQTENTLYITFSRSLFVLGVAFLMHSCFCGYGGVLKGLFEWSVWTPLARLTYTAYLLHPVIIWVIYASRAQTFHYDAYVMSEEFLAHAVLAYAAAAVMYVILEKPMMNLESVLFRVGRH